MKAGKSKDKKAKIYNLYNYITLIKEFNIVDRFYFVELTKYYRKERTKKKRDFLEIETNITISRSLLTKVPIIIAIRDTPSNTY